MVERKVPKDCRKILRAVRKPRLEDLFDEEEIGLFRSFEEKRAVVFGGFLVSISMEDGSNAWIRYRTENIRGKIKHKYNGVFRTENREPPGECEGLPTWWIEN